MSSRAPDLADRVVSACDGFAGYAAGLGPEQWRARCGNHPTIRVGDEDESRPVGTVVHHTAAALGRQLGLIRAIVAGEVFPAPAVPGAANAEHARANPDPDQAATVALLRENGAAIATAVRGLSEDELDRRGQTFRGEMSAAEVVERIVLGHVAWHEGSIRATLGA